MAQNKHVVMIMGRPNSGKSSSLINIKNQEKYVYLNADLKELTFKDNFAVNVEISRAAQVLPYIAEIESNKVIEGVILDTLSALMAMYEFQEVIPSTNGQQAWQGYGTFYRNLIHAIKAGSKHYAIISHEDVVYNEQTMQFESSVPIKGAVKKIGCEADFSTILSAKNVPIKKLEKYKNDLLHITPEEEEDGSKRVFMTRTTKETAGEKMRSPMGLWKREELYIDNNLQQVFTRLQEYFS